MNKKKIFKNFKNELLTIKGIDKYNVYLVGSFNDFLHKTITVSDYKYRFMDIDIWFTSKIYDIEKIKPIIFEATNISEKYEIQLTPSGNLKIDFVYTTQKDFEKTHFDDDMNEYKFKILYPGHRPYKIDTMIEKEMVYPSDKMQERISNGYIKAEPTVLKKQTDIN